MPGFVAKSVRYSEDEYVLAQSLHNKYEFLISSVIFDNGSQSTMFSNEFSFDRSLMLTSMSLKNDAEQLDISG